MKPKRVMLIAGEASGDALAAELVTRLARAIPEAQYHPTAEVQPLTAPLPPVFFGAGGPRMAATGVELAVDMTRHSVTGVSDVIRKYGEFRRIFHELLRLADQRQPDLVVLVDFPGFNLRFARALRGMVRQHERTFSNWEPRIVHYVSPQVWASRASRAKTLEANVDLLLCLFPFEKEWYARHAPLLHVECVGHPVLDRCLRHEENEAAQSASATPAVLLLPGSRVGELKRHIPVMAEAVRQIHLQHPARFKMVLPNDSLLEQARMLLKDFRTEIEIQAGNLPQAMKTSSMAIASTGTVLLECACYGLPVVALYKTSWLTFQIGRRIAQVKFLSMPNLLAGEAVYPEFIQDEATPENLARETLDLLTNTARREEIKSKLTAIVAALGGPGAGDRAAGAIMDFTGWAWQPDLRTALLEAT